MSSYVCDDKTINTIVNSLFYANEKGGYDKLLPRPADELQTAMGENPAEFGKTLYLMNVNAVEQRYPDCIGNPNNLPGQITEDGKHMPYTYKKTSYSMIPGAIVLYKSIQSYLYQCCEGDVDKLPLFIALQEYKCALACHVIEHTSEYENAPWG